MSPAHVTHESMSSNTMATSPTPWRAFPIFCCLGDGSDEEEVEVVDAESAWSCLARSCDWDSSGSSFGTSADGGLVDTGFGAVCSWPGRPSCVDPVDTPPGLRCGSLSWEVPRSCKAGNYASVCVFSGPTVLWRALRLPLLSLLHSSGTSIRATVWARRRTGLGVKFSAAAPPQIDLKPSPLLRFVFWSALVGVVARAHSLQRFRPVTVFVSCVRRVGD